MVYSRANAVSFIESCILNTCGDQNGLIVDDPDNDNVRVFLFNQCALCATALKLAGSSQWPRVAARVNKWIADHQSQIQQTPIRNSHHGVLDQAAVPSQPSFLPNVDVILLSGGPGTNTQPSQILTNTCPVDPLTASISSLSSNRGLLRSVYKKHILSDTSGAQADFDYVMANLVRESGFAIADGSDAEGSSYRYSSGKQMWQWAAATYLSESIIRPELMDTMQLANGSMLQFFRNNSGAIDISGSSASNTEATATSIIVDIIVNGP